MNIIFKMADSVQVNITQWTQTLQGAVNAIRAAAPSNAHTILLPGNDWSGAIPFASNSGPALLRIKNRGGSITNLVFDVHKYLDSGSGSSSTCISSYLNEAWIPPAQWLRCHGRQAFVTEIGGGNTASCVQYMCPVISYLNANSDGESLPPLPSYSSHFRPASRCCTDIK